MSLVAQLRSEHEQIRKRLADWDELLAEFKECRASKSNRCSGDRMSGKTAKER